MTSTVGTLQTFGMFIEFRPSDTSLPSISTSERFENEPMILNIIEYLRSGVVFVATPGLVRDTMRSDCPVIGPGHLCTDGCWIWPYELSYIVDQYKVKVPSEFRERMESRMWIPPSEEELDFGALERAFFEQQ